MDMQKQKKLEQVFVRQKKLSITEPQYIQKRVDT